MRLRPLSPLVLSATLAACYYYGNGTGYGGGAGGSGGAGGQLARGSPCDGFAQTDACAPAGLACTPILADGGFMCELPGPLYACDPSVGCATRNFSCVNGTCLQGCATTRECFDPLTTCRPLQAGGTRYCQVTSCTGLGTACGAATGDGGDGTCVVLSNDPKLGPQGACQQGGVVPVGGRCSFYREDGGAGFCAPGLLCMVNQAGTNDGICLPACDPFTPGLVPGCDAGSSCVPTLLPLPPPRVSSADFYDETGVCAQSCATAGDGGAGAAADGGAGDAGAPPATGCAAPLSCVNGSLTATPDFVCLP